MKEFVFLLFLTAASFSDIRCYRIDNGLNLAGGTAGLALLLSSGEISVIKDGLIASTLVFISLFLVYALKFIGAGDIKFLMAASLYTGKDVLWASLPFMLFAAILMIFPMILKNKSFTGIRFPAAVPISAGLLCGMAFA